MTSEWLFRNHKDSGEALDYTYMVTGYIKAIEELLYDLILILGQGRTIGKNDTIVNGRNDEDRAAYMLQSMQYFLKNHKDFLYAFKKVFIVSNILNRSSFIYIK